MNGVFQWIINQIPPHDVYIEPFLGSGAILRKKRPASRTVGIDKSPNVLRLWRGNEIPALELHCCDGIDWLKFHFGGFRLGHTGPTDVDELTAASGPRTFIYCDPPYLNSLRKSDRSPYECQFTNDDHDRFLAFITAVPANVMVSGYDSLAYREALVGWRLAKLNVSTRANSNATECLWMNYAEPTLLHDYSFIGADNRERERIRRRLKSLTRKVQQLSQIERQALSKELDAFFETTSISNRET